MRPHASLFFGFLLAATTSLQAQLPEGYGVVPASGTPVRATYDLDAATFRVLDSEPAGYEDSALCYDNSVDLDPFLGPGNELADALVFPPGDEVFDWGIKFCGGSNFVDQLTIGFASFAPVGFNGSLTLRVYSRAFGFGVHGTPVAELPLTGLLSNGPFVPPHGLIPVYLTIELGSQSFYLPEGPIGWSYTNPDGMTGPLLVDVRIDAGTQNFFDVYSPGPAVDDNFQGTFLLPPGGASNDPLENSFYIQINENTVFGQSAPIPTAGNPQNLFSVGRPIIGTPWEAVVDLSSIVGATTSFLAITGQDIPGGTNSPYGTLVIDPFTLVGPGQARPAGVNHVFDLPIDPSLVGKVLYAQAFFDSAFGFLLSNGLELTVGSF